MTGTIGRRTFVAVLACAGIAVTRVARSQAAASVHSIGMLKSGKPAEREEVARERDALAKLGWVEGRNLLVERRLVEERPEILRQTAEELVRLKVEIIVTSGTAATLAAKSVTSTIPIVFWSAGDPVRLGLVASLRRPGANVTGYSIAATEMSAKRVAVLQEWLPALRRIGILENAMNPYYRATHNDLGRACRDLGIEPIFIEVGAASELPRAVAAVKRRGAAGLAVGPDSLFYDNRADIMRAALEHGLPTTTSRVNIRELGALISYDPTDKEEIERGASFIDRILRGAKPGELPVEQPTRFELTINLNTAKALGLSVPPALRQRAEIIE